MLPCANDSKIEMHLNTVKLGWKLGMTTDTSLQPMATTRRIIATNYNKTKFDTR